MSKKRIKAKTKKASRRSRREPKGQGRLLDVTHPAQRELCTLVERYRDARDARMAALKPELELRGQLLGVMLTNKLTEFNIGELTVLVVHGQDKVKVRVRNEEKEEEEEEDLECTDEEG